MTLNSGLFSSQSGEWERCIQSSRNPKALAWYYRHRPTVMGRGTMRHHDQAARKVRALSGLECAWLGALVEGEGYLGMSQSRPGPAVEVTSVEIETIATCLRLIGTGSICYRAPRQNHHKPLWYWRLGDKDAVAALLRQIWPYLTGKREKALRVIRQVGQEVSCELIRPL